MNSTLTAGQLRMMLEDIGDSVPVYLFDLSKDDRYAIDCFDDDITGQIDLNFNSDTEDTNDLQ